MTAPNHIDTPAPLPPELQAGANFIGDLRGLLIFSRKRPEIAVDDLLGKWLQDTPEYLRAIAKAAAPAPQGAAPAPGGVALECLEEVAKYLHFGNGTIEEAKRQLEYARVEIASTPAAQGAPHEGEGLDLEARLRAAFEEGLEVGVEEGLYLSSPTPGGMPRDPSGRDMLWEKSGTRASLEGRAS